MKIRWLYIRESAVSLLRIFTVLVVLFLLVRLGFSVFRIVDSYSTWDGVSYQILQGLALVAHYGGLVFAFSWIVSLIGNQTEENARSGWLDNKESAVSLLKILALSIVLFYLAITGIGIFTSVDSGAPWYQIVAGILEYITNAAFYGGTVFALSWIVSLLGRQTEENARSGWLYSKESAVSLLRQSALWIVLLCLPLTIIRGFLLPDWHDSWDWTVDSILYILFLTAYRGATIFALSWIVELIGRGNADELPDSNM